MVFMALFDWRLIFLDGTFPSGCFACMVFMALFDWRLIFLDGTFSSGPLACLVGVCLIGVDRAGKNAETLV